MIIRALPIHRGGSCHPRSPGAAFHLERCAGHRQTPPPARHAYEPPSLPDIPSLPVDAWWAIAALAGVIYLAVMVPWMSTPSTKEQVSLVPLLAAGYVTFMCLGQHMSVPEALGSASAGLLGVPLSMVGYQRELARRILKWEANGSSRGELRAPPVMIARYMVTVPAMFVLGMWLGK